MRRQFRLPEGDEVYLDSLGLPWETIVDQGTQWLVVHNYPVPDGYNCKTALAALRVLPGYPDVQIDMVYFHPALSLTGGRAIGGLSVTQFDGKHWQQWSRHRTAQNPWRPGVDDIAGHFTLVGHWLAQELRRG